MAKTEKRIGKTKAANQNQQQINQQAATERKSAPMPVRKNPKGVTC